MDLGNEHEAMNEIFEGLDASLFNVMAPVIHLLLLAQILQLSHLLVFINALFIDWVVLNFCELCLCVAVFCLYLALF